jgi:hypothetical protein
MGDSIDKLRGRVKRQGGLNLIPGKKGGPTGFLPMNRVYFL